MDMSGRGQTASTEVQPRAARALMSRTVRIVLIVLGLLAVLGGVFAWTIEDEYGAGLDFSTRPRDGQTAVYEAQAGEEPVFVGSRDEAFEYMEQRRAAGESFVLSGAIIAAGAIVVIVGALAGRGTNRAT
jgi:hypothetical protein